jgi:hypothetical protein
MLQSRISARLFKSYTLRKSHLLAQRQMDNNRHDGIVAAQVAYNQSTLSSFFVSEVQSACAIAVGTEIVQSSGSIELLAFLAHGLPHGSCVSGT